MSLVQVGRGLEARNLVLTRGRRTVFNGFSLVLEAGVTAILGPNGAGKSTLMEALSSPRGIDNGEVLLHGSPVLATGRSERDYHSQIGYMPQSWRFFQGFTALESVEYVAWLKRLPSGQQRAAARDALDTVGLTEAQDQKISKFSGGMRQRVGLAEALVNDPAVVLLDEPTVGLDPGQRASFRTALRSGARSRITLLSTHLTDDVATIADRVIVVAAGMLLFDGTPAALTDKATGDGEISSRIERGYLAVLEGPSKDAP